MQRMLYLYSISLACSVEWKKKGETVCSNLCSEANKRITVEINSYKYRESSWEGFTTSGSDLFNFVHYVHFRGLVTRCTSAHYGPFEMSEGTRPSTRCHIYYQTVHKFCAYRVSLMSQFKIVLKGFNYCDSCGVSHTSGMQQVLYWQRHLSPTVRSDRDVVSEVTSRVPVRHNSELYNVPKVGRTNIKCLSGKRDEL